LPRYRLSELAERIGGELRGPDLEVSGINALSLAGPEELSFVESRRHLDEAKASQAEALLVPPALAEELAEKALILVANVRAAMAKLAWLFYDLPHPAPGISPLAVVEVGAQVHPEVAVAPFVYIAAGACIARGVVLYPGVYVGPEVEIGEDVVVYPNAVLYPRTKIGPKSIIHAGAVVGCDGFGYAQEKGRHIKIPHFGRAELGPEVELGANTTVDRAGVGATVLGAGTKIDNLVQIGHNVIMGEACIVAGQAGFVGSTRLGRGVMVGGQAGTAQVSIGDLAMIAARAGVAKDVPPKAKVAGAPALEASRWRRCVAAYERLPELLKEIRELRKRVEQLEKVRENG